MAGSVDVAAILGPQGRIAQRLQNYESRPEQLQMAQAVADAIAQRRHLVVEAGTGVGKSFAYLVPAILSATQPRDDAPIGSRHAGRGPSLRHEDEDADSRGSDDDDESARPEAKPKRIRIVVSTHTISLQEQLIARDIPFLRSVLPVEFSAVLVKGRGNYISLRRLAGAIEKARTLFDDDESATQLRKIEEWAKTTTDGTRASLDFKPLPTVWDEVQSDSGNCLGRRCPTYEQCHYFAARRRVWNADILVVNHALFFSDLAVKRDGGNLLPEYDVVIFDEAHTVEAVAGDHLGLSISNGQVEYLLNKLYNERSQKGLLKSYQHMSGQELVVNTRFLSQDFFDAVHHFQQRMGLSNGRFRKAPDIDIDLARPLTQLAKVLSDLAEPMKDEGAKMELVSAGLRCLALAGSITTWLNQSMADAVYWLEASGRRQERIQLLCAPVEVGPVLHQELFNVAPSVVLTSATVAVGDRDFGFLRNRLGVGAAEELKLGSPFDYRKNAKLILPKNMPDPNERPADYEAAVCERIKKYILQTDGRAFVLFTSYRMLENCASRLEGWMRQNRFSLYSQAAGAPRTLLLDRYRNDTRGVLFGAETFWQGVDVPGDALKNVIITKLPFSVPDHPLLEARLETIRQNGGNPFFDYQVPEAVIKLKQGFGRLIRTKTDTGQVAILDPRVRTKRYGQTFLASLPQCMVIHDD